MNSSNKCGGLDLNLSAGEAFQSQFQNLPRIHYNEFLHYKQTAFPLSHIVVASTAYLELGKIATIP